MRPYALPAIRYMLVLFLISSLIGCDAFVRKFTRKSKTGDMSTEQMVLEPEIYKPPVMTKEEAYRQYFLFWKSWQDELISSLTTGASRKKQMSCTDEALKNLNGLREALQPEAQKKLDVYIGQMKELGQEISRDTYGGNSSRNRVAAESIRRGIMRDFSYNKIKDRLI